MAACGSLRHIFENTENKSSSSTSSLIDSLTSWKPIKPFKPPLDHSLTEIFGELHFKENHSNPISTSSFFTPPLSSSSSLSSSLISYNSVNVNDYKNGNNGCIFGNNDGYSKTYHRKSDSFSNSNFDSLKLCTEGLGSESMGDVEDLKTDNNNNERSSDNLGEEKEKEKEKVNVRRHLDESYSYCRNMRVNGKAIFPPPISYMGKSGKPAVSFQSYRKDGRFVLKEIRIPKQECLQASREDGRLRLSFVQSSGDDDDDDHDHDHDEGDENGVENDGGEDEMGELGCFGRIEEGEKEVEDEDEIKE